MPRMAFRLLVALLVLLPLQALAAPLRLTLPPQALARVDSPDDQAWALLRVVAPGTRLVVGQPTGAVAGSFVGVDTESITLKDAGYEGPRVVIPRREVTIVIGPSHRHMGPHLLRGVLIGFAVGALLGTGASEAADRGVVGMVGAFGAGIGLATGAVAGLGSDPEADVLYRRPVAPRPPDAAQPPAARTSSVESLSSLSTRVIPFQTIYVRTRNGEAVAGTFSAASDEKLRMEVRDRTREIAAADVREVRLRGGRQVKRGGLIGLGAGAAAAGIMVVASRDNGGSDADVRVPFVIGGAVAGLIWGSIIGAFVHERPLVYTSATPSVRVTPLVSPRQVGVLASVRF